MLLVLFVCLCFSNPLYFINPNLTKYLIARSGYYSSHGFHYNLDQISTILFILFQVGSPIPSWWMNITMNFDLGNLSFNESVDATIVIWFPTLLHQFTFAITLDIDHEQLSKQVCVPRVSSAQ